MMEEVFQADDEQESQAAVGVMQESFAGASQQLQEEAEDQSSEEQEF